MRSIRFLDAAPRAGDRRWFGHPSFEFTSTGFMVLREALQALQQRRLPRLQANHVVRGGSELAMVALTRVARRRVYIPNGTRTNIQLDIEQTPQDENKLSLSGQRDRFGRQVMTIDWRVTESDSLAIDIARKRFLALWPPQSSGFPPLRLGSDELETVKPHDAYHPAGTCRMGEGPEAVVDYKMRVHGISNLFVASTAVLPSAGAANPTFTLLCLCDQLGTTLTQALDLN